MVSKLLVSKPLYMATSLEELMSKAEECEVLVVMENTIMKSVAKAAERYDEGMWALMTGDEERAFVHFYRYFLAVKSIKRSDVYQKNKDFYDKLIATNKFENAIQVLEELSKTLISRYVTLTKNGEQNNDSVSGDFFAKGRTAEEVAGNCQQLVQQKVLNTSQAQVSAQVEECPEIKSYINKDLTEKMSTFRIISNSSNVRNKTTDCLNELTAIQSESDFGSERKTNGQQLMANHLEPIAHPSKESFALKLLVEYNNQKHCVCIETDYKILIFKKILIEIRRQICDQISSDSHWFEIFDKDFAEYVSIGSEFQVVENLDRLRVRPKKAFILALNCMEFDISGNYRLTAKCPHMYHKIMIEKFKDKFLVTIRFRSDYFKGMQKLLKFLEINRNGFEKRQIIDAFHVSNPWQTVADQMMASGFEDWSPLKCRQCFTCAIDLYKRTLQKCLDFEIASVVNPLFADFHVFELNHLLTVHEYNEIRVLRHLFKQQSSSSSSSF